MNFYSGEAALCQSDVRGVGGGEMVTPGRFELPTFSLGNCCSIHLSYGATTGCVDYRSSFRKLLGSARLRSLTERKAT